jgi:3-deoxy-7-phosphoheptulonate synthase
MSLVDKRVWGPTPRYPELLSTDKGGAFKDMIIIAGPCSVESPAQISKIVPVLKDSSVTFARGGVFRAGTYPPQDFGLRREILGRWARDVRKAGLKTIIEVIDIRQIKELEPYADAFQIGARHCQDYALLTELAAFNKVVSIKRGMGMTLDEFLGAAEYLTRGRCTPILIERGSATHMNHVRWDLSISLIAAVKRVTGLPILVDASHGTGRRDLVEPMIMAGIAAGADGFLIEVHPDPEKSISDADQAVPLGRLFEIQRRARIVKMAVEA